MLAMINIYHFQSLFTPPAHRWQKIAYVTTLQTSQTSP